MYHAVHPSIEMWETQKPAGRWYAVVASQFEAQMDYLAREGYSTVLLQEFLSGQAPERSVVLTFDDGHKTNHSVVVPILRRYGFRAEFFANVSFVGQSNFMTWEQLRSLADVGMSVQSHGIKHNPMTRYSRDELIHELCGSREAIETHVGSKVKYFAAPGGFVDKRVCDEALAAGYEAVCNSEPGLAQMGTVIKRVAVMHSTSQRQFETLVQRKPGPLFRMRAQRELAKTAKALFGIERYEAWKKTKLKQS
jgi:peptidoglycan/xylan/chitin deacetylase (PgdA/CDA1 family)